MVIQSVHYVRTDGKVKLLLSVLLKTKQQWTFMD